MDNEEDLFDISDREDESEQEEQEEDNDLQSFAQQDEESQRKTN